MAVLLGNTCCFRGFAPTLYVAQLKLAQLFSTRREGEPVGPVQEFLRFGLFVDFDKMFGQHVDDRLRCAGWGEGCGPIDHIVLLCTRLLECRYIRHCLDTLVTGDSKNAHVASLLKRYDCAQDRKSVV